MFIYVISILYWFFRVIEIALVAYILLSWLPIAPKLRILVSDIMKPLLNPVRRMLSTSVFNTRGLDLSPIILYLITAYCLQLCVRLR